MKKVTVKLIILLLCIGCMAIVVGCSGKKGTGSQEFVTGGVTDTSDYDAPKVIESEELIYFRTEFYRYSDYVYNADRRYKFCMSKNDDGSYTISEGDNEELKCETNAEFAVKLQQIIKDNNLVEWNGTHKQTAGLAPEYRPYWVEALYASDEKLSFFMNGDPMAEWTWQVLDLFANEFGTHGITDLLPVKEEAEITRFNIEYAYGDIRYYYGEKMVPVTEEEKNRTVEDRITNGANEDDCINKVYADIWDRTGKTEVEDDRQADVTEEYYAEIKKIVDEENLIYFQNGEIIPGNFDYENTPEFYEFYIEYENGNRMSGFSDDPVQCEKFKAAAERFAKFYDDYLEQ
ncbi:MAG: hypothetical protein KBS96_08375 [Lachnospiraceae bacterium]|nr:hypothetical protein [Candidatus Colinaster scatohippi]